MINTLKGAGADIAALIGLVSAAGAHLLDRAFPERRDRRRLKQLARAIEIKPNGTDTVRVIVSRVRFAEAYASFNGSEMIVAGPTVASVIELLALELTS